MITTIVPRRDQKLPPMVVTASGAKRGRGTEDEMDTLHGLVCDILLKLLRTAEESGKSPNPRLLACAIAFLKVNGVDTPARSLQKVDALRAEMPDFDEE